MSAKKPAADGEKAKTVVANDSEDLKGTLKSIGGSSSDRWNMRITGSDAEGQEQLDNFIYPESNYPVLITTSRLLSTGVEVRTCRLIVLDREVGSMTELKQIVGRGTRVHEDTKKFHFTLIDCRGATSQFADPDFDGEPVQIYQPGDGDPIAPPDDLPPPGEDGETPPDKPGADETIVDGPPDLTLPLVGGKMKTVYVEGVGATIIAERVEYLAILYLTCPAAMCRPKRNGTLLEGASLGYPDTSHHYCSCSPPWWRRLVRQGALVLGASRS